MARIFDVLRIFANNPGKERKVFPQYSISDILLPPWEERVNKHYHEVPNQFKWMNIPIANVRCNAYIHNSYQCDPSTKMSSEKHQHGHHCSLYDSYELYLFYLLHITDL